MTTHMCIKVANPMNDVNPGLCPAFVNSEDSDQLASCSSLFVIKLVDLYKQLGSSNLIG